MSEQPRVGDRVRVTFEGKYVRKADGDHHIVKADEDWSHETPNGAVLEVLEPADDPSKDPVGTVRRRMDYPVSRPVVRQDTCGRPWKTLSGTYYDHHEVTGWEVIGFVPGTPAAEAQEPKYGLFQTPPEKPVPYSQWQRRKYDWRPQSGCTPHAPDDETREVPS